MQPEEIRKHVETIATQINRDNHRAASSPEDLAAQESIKALVAMVLTDIHWIANSLYRIAEAHKPATMFDPNAARSMFNQS